MNDNIKMYLQRNPEMQGISVWMFDESVIAKKQRSIATQIEFQTFTDEDALVQQYPLFYLNETSAQHLMNELWREGVRPSDIGTAGHLESVKYHLEDMRKLVFDRQDI